MSLGFKPLDTRQQVTRLDALGRTIVTTDPKLQSNKYACWFETDQKTSLTTPKDEVCTYSYDLRDRPILADWNTNTPDTARTYFANGLLKSIDNCVSKSVSVVPSAMILALQQLLHTRHS